MLRVSVIGNSLYRLAHPREADALIDHLAG
jgi:hypothetical protein